MAHRGRRALQPRTVVAERLHHIVADVLGALALPVDRFLAFWPVGNRSASALPVRDQAKFQSGIGIDGAHAESAGNTGVVVVRAVDQEVVVSFTLPVDSEPSQIGALSPCPPGYAVRGCQFGDIVVNKSSCPVLLIRDLSAL